MNARQTGFACWAALVALHLAWHAWLAPPSNGAIGLALALSLLPLLLPLLVLRAQPQRALLWIGMLCLFYFCHGIVVAWGDARARALGWAEIALTLALIGSLGWSARGYRKKRPTV
jgi:uncharacterized membrane protein